MRQNDGIFSGIKQENGEIKDLANPDSPATKGDFNDFAAKQNILQIGVIIVLFVGFITLLLSTLAPIIDAWRFRAASYENLSDKIGDQTMLINELKSEIRYIEDRYLEDRKSRMKYRSFEKEPGYL